MAEVITSGKVIQKPEVVVGVDDFLPPGVLGVRRADRDEAGQIGESGENEGGTPEFIVEDDSGNVGQLPIPYSMKIISQTEVVGKDGKVTIDVLIETDDFPGIREFEARVTKFTS